MSISEISWAKFKLYSTCLYWSPDDDVLFATLLTVESTEVYGIHTVDFNSVDLDISFEELSVWFSLNIIPNCLNIDLYISIGLVSGEHSTFTYCSGVKCSIVRAVLPCFEEPKTTMCLLCDSPSTKFLSTSFRSMYERTLSLDTPKT